MPLYDYVCQQCGRHTEKIQSFSAAPLTVCPHCGGHLEKAITAPAVQFKGAGWYVTDYSKSGSSKPASKGDAGQSGDAPAPSDSASKSSTPPVSAAADASGSSSAKKESAPAPAAASAPSKSE